MSNPTSTQVQKVIDTFKLVLPMIKKDAQLHMQESHVNTAGHTCGTTHCHGGWYAIGYLGLKKQGFLQGILFPQQQVNFQDGTRFMCEDLGIGTDYYHNVSIWANANPIIWGNSTGAQMFSSPYAFYSKDRPYGAKSVQHIIDHWTEVRDRLITLEQIESVLKIAQDDLPQTTDQTVQQARAGITG